MRKHLLSWSTNLAAVSLLATLFGFAVSPSQAADDKPFAGQTLRVGTWGGAEDARRITLEAIERYQADKKAA